MTQLFGLARLARGRVQEVSLLRDALAHSEQGQAGRKILVPRWMILKRFVPASVLVENDVRVTCS